MLPLVLVVEDGHEYITNLTRFLSEHFRFERAGDGPAALERLAAGGVDAVFLDMKFDRSTRWLGDLEQLERRFAGDSVRAQRFLEDNQGAYVLAGLREAGHTLPVVFSYDFDGEPRRFRNLSTRYGPLDYLADTAGPADIRAALSRASGGGAQGAG